MELVLKLPKDKLPFIGVLFENSYKASTINQELVSEYKNIKFKAILKPNGTLMNLIIESQEIRFKYVYECLTYDKQKLDNFLIKVPSDGLINFSHLIKKHDTDVVAKTLGSLKLFVLKIDGYYLEEVY